MNKEILAIIEDSGWYPGRKIDISSITSEIEREGYHSPNTLLKNLFIEFWNLDIKFNYNSQLIGNIRLVVEDAFYAEPELLDKCGKLIGETLVPCGSINSESASLIGSFSGKFYMFAEKKLYLIGCSFYDAIATIVCKKEVRQIDIA